MQYVSSLVALAGLVVACGSDGDGGGAGGAAGSSGGAGGTGAMSTGSGGSQAGAGGTSSGGTAGGAGAGGDAGMAGGAGAGGSAGAAGSPAGCPTGALGSPPSDYITQFGSGTRLAARYYAADGMPPIFAGFFDTELGVECDFVLASDDEWRCLPRSAATIGHLGWADTGCTKDVYRLSTACADQPAYLRVVLECRDKFAVHEAVPHTGETHYGTPDSCSGGSVVSDVDAFTAGAEVPATSFVAGTPRDLPGVCDAGLRIIEATDGAFGPLEVFDVASGAACEAADGFCTPAHRAHHTPSLFGDAACMEPIQVASSVDAASCAAPVFIRSVDTDGYYRVAGAATQDVWSESGGCEPALDRPWIGSLWELGEFVPPEGLAALSAIDLGSGRLRATAIGEGATPLMQSARLPNFVDTERSERCWLLPFDADVWRCVPTDAFLNSEPVAFDDPNCELPLFECFDEVCTGKLVYSRTLPPDRCVTTPDVATVWEFGPAATGNYQKVGEACMEVGPAEPVHYRLIEASPSEFAVVTLSTAE